MISMIASSQKDGDFTCRLVEKLRCSREIQYLEVTVGKQTKELDIRIGKSNTIMRKLQHLFAMRLKLSIFERILLLPMSGIVNND